MAIDTVYPEDLAELTRDLGEENYSLVDVRQPQEYQAGHIPGARLIPLPELESAGNELGRKPNLIFYCRSGARSMVASNWAVDHLGPDVRVTNLIGGFTAWEGKELREMPRLRLFEAPQSVPDALLRAMDLEKGAQNFYLAAASAAQAASPELARTLHILADVEQAHAKVLYHRFCKIQDQAHSRCIDQESFEQKYASLAGDILEGGLGLEEALDRLDASKPLFCLEVTDVALEIELMAYDLYRNLAAASDGDMEQMFLKLAKDEQGHQRLLVRQLPDCDA